MRFVTVFMSKVTSHMQSDRLPVFKLFLSGEHLFAIPDHCARSVRFIEEHEFSYFSSESVKPWTNGKCLASKHHQTLFGDQTFYRLDTLFGAVDRVWRVW